MPAGAVLSVSFEPPVFKSQQQVAADLKAALKIFDKYYRLRVGQRFAAQGPGWPPRKHEEQMQAPREKAAHELAEHKVKLKVFRELKRAQKRWLRGKGKLSAVVRRARVVEEFKKQVGGETSPFFSSDKRLTKSVSKLRERVNRAEAAASARLLGRFPSAMKSKLSGFVLSVSNTIPFSAAQNDGAVVGHGSQLPARPFNYFDVLDVEVFAEIVANMVMVAAA